MKGKYMILSDILSRQKIDDSNSHEIIPISFNIFCFNTKFYKQLWGAAMGSPVSPSLQISTWNTLNP